MTRQDELIIAAAHFARDAHKGQTRKYTGRPYITHPGRVAARVTLLPNVMPEMVAAAWLHDVIEDCGVEPSTLGAHFGTTVTEMVRALTNPSKGRTDLSRAERKQLDRTHLDSVPLAAKLIKLADRTDNLNEMADAPPEFKRLYAHESRLLAISLMIAVDESGHGELFSELTDAMRRLDPAMK